MIHRSTKNQVSKASIICLSHQINLVVLYFIFTLNFGNLYLYPLLFRISIILVFPTSILNSDLVNFQRFLADNDPFLSTLLRAYLTCSFSIFLGDLLWFFCCLQEILQISYNDQRRFWIFPSDHESFQALYIWEVLLYFNNCKKLL